jgi:hypothetical protein
MLKRSGTNNAGSMDYAAIPETDSPAASQNSWGKLKMFLLLACALLVVLGLTRLSTLSNMGEIRAGCNLTTDFSNSCSDVQSEISQRVFGQTNKWHDPHNNGSYSFVGLPSKEKSILQRVSGTGSKVKYIDSIELTFEPSQNDDKCRMSAKSSSQVFSILDFGTNFCNINNLYCTDNKACQSFGDLKYVYTVGKCTDSTIKSCYTV